MSEAAGAPDLLQLSAQRGKFLELVAQRHDFWGFDPESLHLLGLFSLLDTMLGTPMDEIVTFLPSKTSSRAPCAGRPTTSTCLWSGWPSAWKRTAGKMPEP